MQCSPRSLQVREELFVDTSRGEKLRINFDIDFPRMPCVCERPCVSVGML